MRDQPRASLLSSSDPGALLFWLLGLEGFHGRIWETESEPLTSDPSSSHPFSEMKKVSLLPRRKGWADCTCWQYNSQAFNKDLHVGKFVYHCELDRFLILKDFLMRLAVMLTNVTSLMLYNEICQHLEDLCNSVN